MKEGCGTLTTYYIGIFWLHNTYFQVKPFLFTCSCVPKLYRQPFTVKKNIFMVFFSDTQLFSLSESVNQGELKRNIKNSLLCFQYLSSLWRAELLLKSRSS